MTMIGVSSDAAFDESYAAAGDTVLVYIGSKSCGPSLAMFEIIDQFLGEMTEFTAIMAAIEDCPEAARRYEIKHTPSSIVVLNGIPHGTLAGTATIDQFMEFVADVVSRPPAAPKPKKQKGQ